MIHREVLSFLASKEAISALSLYGFDSLRSKILRMGEEITIHMAFFVWHLKTALPSFRGIQTNASIIIFTFRATNPRSSELKYKSVPSKSPTRI